MEVAGHRHGRAAPGHRLERPLEEPACLVGAAAAGPHRREDDGRPQHVGGVASGTQLPDRLAERVDRGGEVAGRPRREAEEPAGGAAREVVVRPGHVQGLAGEARGPGEVAAGLRRRRPVHRDHGRAAPRGPHVRPRTASATEAGIPSPAPPTHRRHPVRRSVGRHERRLRGVEPGVDAVEVPLGQPQPRLVGGQQRAVAGDLIGDQLEASRGAAGPPGAGAGPGRRARRGRRPARTSSPARACGTASGRRPSPAYHCAATRWRRRTRSGSSAVSRARRASAKRWW